MADIPDVPPRPTTPLSSTLFLRSFDTLIANSIGDKRTNSLFEEELEDRQCTTCAESFPAKDVVALTSCSHEAETCMPCFLAYLELQMGSKVVGAIECPSSDCRQLITHNDVHKYASAEMFDRFDNLSMRSLLSADPDFRYCLAPGCDSGQFHDVEEGNVFRCVACDFKACVTHDTAFHEGETCAQYDELMRGKTIREEQEAAENAKTRAQQDKDSAEEIKRCAKTCTKCKTPIQKIEGCDHMTCSRCGCEFCYLCGALYWGNTGILRTGNAAHNQGCNYRPEALPPHPDEPDNNDDENFDEILD